MPVLPEEYMFVLDPFQARAVRTCLDSEHTWVHGGDQHKRLQILIHLVLHNAAHGRSTLVCADNPTRQSVMDALHALGLDHFALTLHGSASATAMAALQVARKKDVREDTVTQCDLAVSKFNTWKHTQERPFTALDRQLFGDMTWKQLADHTATAPRDTSKSQLAAALVTSDFELSQKEYWHIKGRIKTFQRLRVLRTPAFDVLNHLNDKIFDRADGNEAKAALETHLRQVMREGRALLRQIGELVHKYRRDITGAQHESLEQFKNRIHEIETLMVSGEMQFGAEFFAESTFNDFTDRIRRTVSKKSRALHAMRGDIREAYRELVDQLVTISVKSKHADQELLDEPLTMESIADGLTRCKQMLAAWSDQIDAEATDHKRRLNAQNIPEGHLLRQMIHEVEQQINSYVQGLNDLHIFDLPIEVNALSLEKRSMVIKDVVTRCMKVQEAMHDFEAYFLWRSFWSQLEVNVRTLLEGLDIMDDADQMPAFEDWYFENVLEQIPEAQIAQKQMDKDHFDERRDEMHSVVINHIRQCIRQRRHVALKDLRSTQKSLIMSISKGKHAVLNDELRILPAKDLMELFPVVFCNQGDLRDYGYYSDMLCVVDETGVDYRVFMAQARRCVLLTHKMPGQMDPTLSKINFAGLNTRTMTRPFPWNNLPATGKLQHLQPLASQFAPAIKELKIYNTRGLQILSCLGEVCDTYLLRQLKMPYKEMPHEGDVSPQHITETLLDVRKPVVVLVRDQLLGYAYKGHLRWQRQALDFIAACSIPVLNVWSVELKRTGTEALDPIVTSLQAISDTVRKPKTPNQESPILEPDDRSPITQAQGSSTPASSGSEVADLRSNPSEVGGIPA